MNFVSSFLKRWSLFILNFGLWTEISLSERNEWDKVSLEVVNNVGSVVFDDEDVKDVDDVVKVVVEIVAVVIVSVDGELWVVVVAGFPSVLKKGMKIGTNIWS